MKLKNIVNFIFELGQLKKQPHSGFWHAGVKNPTSVAEHQFRAAQIGYVLGVMEGVNPEKVAVMALIHDNAEARIGDQNKVSARYFSDREAEDRALSEQLENLGGEIKKKWLKYFNEYEHRTTKEGIIAKDADWLEVAFQAKEYFDIGHKTAWDWINNVEKALETKSAKAVIKEMKKTEFTDWWQGFKKMTYKKLK